MGKQPLEHLQRKPALSRRTDIRYHPALSGLRINCVGQGVWLRHGQLGR